MGKYIFDQYSLLHFSTGVVAYFWGLKFPTWAFAHLIFEIIENTQLGMKFINNLYFWPGGGKPSADTFINILGDNIAGILGWMVAKYLDKLGSELGWYEGHLF